MNHHEDGFPLSIGHVIARSAIIATLIAVVGAVVVFAVSERLEPTYRAVATVLASNTNPSLARFDVAIASPPSIDLAAYRSVVLSRPIVDRARELVSDPSLFDRARLSASADIMNISSLIRIEVRTGDPDAAAEAANAMANALLDWDQQRSSDNLQRIMAALDEQITAITEQILILQVTEGVAADQLEGQVRLRAERQQQLASVRAVSASVVGMLEIVEPATVPEVPVVPQPATYAGVSFVALLLLITGTLVLAHVLDSRPRSGADVARALSLPVLAEFGSSRRRAVADHAALGYLRANLDPQLGDAYPRVLLLTSVTRVPGQGRLARAFAMTYVEDGLETLFLDADFLDPSLSSLLKPGEPTLEDHLDGENHEVVEPVRLPDGLSVLGNLGGGPGSGSHLLRRGFGRAVQAWQQRYDVVVINASPMLDAADALSLMPMVSGALVVVDVKSITPADLRQALSLTRANRGRVLGLLVVHGGMRDERGAVAQHVVGNHRAVSGHAPRSRRKPVGAR